MNKTTKIWLVIAAFLVLVGCIIFGGVMTILKWDFTKLSTFEYETNDYKIDEDYTNILIVTDTADVVFVPCENSKSSVVCYEQKKAKHLVTVNDGTLVIEVVDTRKWYEHIGVNFSTPKMTVYIPQGDYGTLSVKSSTGDVEIPKDFNFESIDILGSTGNVKNYACTSGVIKIKTSTGNIYLENASANTLDLSVSTGKIEVFNVFCEDDMNINVSTGKTKLNNIECKNFTSSGNTGDIYLNNVIAAEKMSIKRSTGDIRFDGSDATEIFVETDTGDVTGTLISEKVFIARTDTGRINVPKTTHGGKCEINTDTGDIRLEIK